LNHIVLYVLLNDEFNRNYAAENKKMEMERSEDVHL
jgi:hypothetical protein